MSETVLWQEYMVYAALLGIAEQVLEQVRTLYPQQLSQVERYQRYLHGTNQYNHYLYAAVARQRQAAQAARSGGSGGFASLGGGGGFFRRRQRGDPLTAFDQMFFFLPHGANIQE